jgi:hypothetical protein
MPQPLLTRQERRSLTEAAILLLSNHSLTASQLADWLGCTPSQIHSVLLGLRADGIVRAIDLRGDSRGSALEHVWSVTEHACHDPRQILPGIPRCEHCRRTHPAG